MGRRAMTLLQSIVLGIIQGLTEFLPISRLGWMLVLASIPAVIAGLIFKDPVERAFGSPVAASLLLLGTAVLLLIAEWVGKGNRLFASISWLDALIVGLFQAVSLLPGISRSGSTITGGM